MDTEVSFDKIYSRIQQISGCRTQVKVACLLDIPQSAISAAKRRGHVPDTWYMTLFSKLGVNPDWIKYHRGPLYLRTGDNDYTPVYELNGHS